MPTEVDQEKMSTSQLFENMRHDIRSSLIGILGLAQSIQNDLKNTSYAIQSETLTNAIAAHLDFQTNLLDSVVKQTINSTTFYLHDLMNNVIALVKPQAKLKNLNLDYTIEETLKKQVLSSSSRLFRVLYALLSNAIKFTECGEVKLQLSAQNCCDADFTLHIQIKDTGVGIAASDSHFIFERYYRGNTNQAGMGIGLSQVKEDIAALNGSITVKSEVGKGSIFFCYIPMRFENDTPITTILNNQPLHGMRVLLIEDHPVAATMAKNQLEALGCTIDIATTYQSSMHLLKKNKYNYILMDLNLPDISSTELLSSIRKINQFIVIIGLTANKKINETYPDLAAILEKPIAVIELINTLKSVGIL